MEIERGLAAGRLVHDARFREFMERIADSPAAVARRVATQDSGDPTLAAERAQLEYDAMHVLGRTERMLMIRQDFRLDRESPPARPPAAARFGAASGTGRAPCSVVGTRRVEAAASEGRDAKRGRGGRGRMKVVMALKVRDEEDVIEHNLRYHRAQGVDFFIVTDNGSVDRTLRSSSAGSRPASPR